MSDQRRQPADLPPRLREVLAAANLGPRRKRALEHLPRLELFIFLMERPNGRGASERELAAMFAMSIRLTKYHLKVLQDADLVTHAAGNGKPGSERKCTLHRHRYNRTEARANVEIKTLTSKLTLLLSFG